MNNIQINANRRVDAVLHDTAVITDATIQRVASIALPFLNLNATTGAIASVGMGAYHSWTHLNGIIAAFQANDLTLLGQESGYLILVVSSTALAILFPIGQFVLSNAYQLVMTVHSLSLHIWNGQWQDGGKDFAVLAHQILHVLSVFYGTPEWIVLSLLTQAGVELYQAYQEFSNDRTPEAVANLLLAALRAYNSVPHLQTLHRNYFGQTLTQDQWLEIYSKIETSRFNDEARRGTDVESFLIEKGISSHINDIQFNETANLTHLTFKNMRFQRCNFNDVTFEGSSMHRVSADSCLFEGALWMHSVVQNCFFSHCRMANAACIRSEVSGTTIADSDMTQFFFNDSHLSRLSLVRDKLLETSFLNATVFMGSITDSDLTDCLLLDTKENFTIKGGTPHQITRPLVAISWNFRNPGRFTLINDASLRENGAIPLRFECSPEDINPDILDREVKELIAAIRAEKSEDIGSIPQELLKRARDDSEIGRIKQKAYSIFKHCHGIAIPGSIYDIHPEFYGAEMDPKTHPEADYRHVLMELSLISFADQAKTPTMGTCRGAQLINVYFDGTLKQDVDGHWATYQLMEHRASRHYEWIRELVGENFLTYSCHHQAIDRIGQDLDLLMENDGVPKFLVSRDGNFIATQVHPEIYHPYKEYIESNDKPMDPYLTELYKTFIEKNQNIYRYFVAKARERWLHQALVDG